MLAQRFPIAIIAQSKVDLRFLTECWPSNSGHEGRIPGNATFQPESAGSIPPLPANRGTLDGQMLGDQVRVRVYGRTMTGTPSASSTYHNPPESLSPCPVASPG